MDNEVKRVVSLGIAHDLQAVQISQSAKTSGILCGIYKETFCHRVSRVWQVEQKKKKSGKPNQLSIKDQVVINLSKARKYHTYFHLVQPWEVRDSNVCFIILKLETALVLSGVFNLPGKKQLHDHN